jgi:rubrerythrin
MDTMTENTIKKIYQYALQREIEGRDFFANNAERMSHASVVDVFKRLAQEEQRHIRIIEEQLRILSGPEAEESSAAPAIEDAAFFTGRARSEMIEQTVSEAMVPDLPVLRMAYLIEKDFADFYAMAASKAAGKAREVLESLAAWERTHESLFKELHDRAFERYADMPWGG